MTAIILEGPDGSGKTTLAEYMQSKMSVPILKSPAGKDLRWEHEWDSWGYRHGVRDALFILDRTPEISELVYASAQRRSPRARTLMTSFSTILNNSGIFLIFCQPPEKVEGLHTDPYGTPIWHDRVKEGYRVVETMLSTHLTHALCTIRSYDYSKGGFSSQVMWDLSSWLWDRNLLVSRRELVDGSGLQSPAQQD